MTREGSRGCLRTYRTSNSNYLIAKGFVVEKDGKLYLIENGVDLVYNG